MAADPAPPVREPAPAKINLYLHVTGKRDDGYHLLDSLVVFCNAGDRIEAVADTAISLEYTGPFASDLPAPGANLVMRAAQELADISGTTAGARLKLFKNLPVASGIGGGSADAAAALRALIRLWQLDASDARISELALSLGADVPVCLMNRPCVMRGIGDDLNLIASFPEFPLVLVNPGIGVSTPDVFRARTGDFSPSFEWTGNTRDAASVVRALGDTSNDLQAAAISKSPAIADVLRTLEAQSGIALARMSGSGATCFGLFENAETAQTAALAIADDEPDWWVQAATVYGA
jgi:4-diphosphocytidyl-2-C-methyl-D-erythritol kinase